VLKGICLNNRIRMRLQANLPGNIHTCDLLPGISRKIRFTVTVTCQLDSACANENDVSALIVATGIGRHQFRIEGIEAMDLQPCDRNFARLLGEVGKVWLRAGFENGTGPIRKTEECQDPLRKTPASGSESC
jgi:hypothetical protein